MAVALFRSYADGVGRSRQQPFVLVVDDYDDNREMYAEYLRFAGCIVATANDGAVGLAKAMARLPDVIVLDLSLPAPDGWTAARALKADPRTRNVPIIAITGHAFGDVDRKARAAGADACLIKPCLPQDLFAAVRLMATRRRSA